MILQRFKEESRSLPANPFFAKLEPHLPVAGRALDLGAGWGQGSAWLAERGWAVDAVEIDPEMVDALRLIPGVSVHEGDMADFPEGEYQLVVGVFSLFFLPPDSLRTAWSRIEKCLQPGGIFGGQLLGPHDDWVKQEIAYGLQRAEIEELLQRFKVLEWQEVDREGKTVWGEAKHWHIHHLIAQRT